MKYSIINENFPANVQSTEEKILYNRGIKNPKKYLSEISLGNLHKTVSDATLLGEDKLNKAYQILTNAIQNNQDMLIVVDSDCDGFTSAALFANYLFYKNPEYYSHINFFFHSGKQHGLNPVKEITEQQIKNGSTFQEAFPYKIIISPDGGTNDFEAHEFFGKNNVDIIILDHHDLEKEDANLPYAVLINNQCSEYPNKELSGVGVTWQFCRYIDNKDNTDFSKQFMDLVALGNCGDMMSMTSPETVMLIWLGFHDWSIIKNPFIQNMILKNQFSLNKAAYKSQIGLISPIGAAFFIVPFINATVRSGTKEEKQTVFMSMLESCANNIVSSTKRGHKLNETETLVTQAVRLVTNIKNRQTKAQDLGMEILEKQIQENDMLKHKALVFVLPENTINPNIAGLAANKIAPKYQRPVCLLFDKGEKYQGSARGYQRCKLDDFKQVCQKFFYVDYAMGHPNAFGLSIFSDSDGYNEFVKYLDEELKDLVEDEPVYKLDFLYKNKKEINAKEVMDIGGMNDYWGTGLDRALVGVENLVINRDNTAIYKKSTNTIKIDAGEVDIMIFNADDELCDEIEQGKHINMNIIGECYLNEFNGNITPQIQVIDYQINKLQNYYF